MTAPEFGVPLTKKPIHCCHQWTSNGWPCSAKFCAFHITLKFSMVGLDQVWWMIYIKGCEWPAICWYDAMYHEADHYLKWPRSANVRIFWSRPADDAVVFIFDKTISNKYSKIYELYYNNFKCIKNCRLPNVVHFELLRVLNIVHLKISLYHRIPVTRACINALISWMRVYIHGSDSSDWRVIMKLLRM